MTRFSRYFPHYFHSTNSDNTCILPKTSMTETKIVQLVASLRNEGSVIFCDRIGSLLNQYIIMACDGSQAGPDKRYFFVFLMTPRSMRLYAISSTVSFIGCGSIFSTLRMREFSISLSEIKRDKSIHWNYSSTIQKGFLISVTKPT